MLQDITCEGKKEANKIFGNTNLREEQLRIFASDAEYS